MRPALPSGEVPPRGAAATRLVHRVAFFETDGMRIVHHANYVRWLELARVAWMDEHHVPYAAYVARGLQFATTRVEIDYRAPARFDDRVAISTWLADTGGASLAMAYRIACGERLLASARTEHACVDDDGRVRRIPAEWRTALRALRSEAPGAAPGGSAAAGS